MTRSLWGLTSRQIVETMKPNQEAMAQNMNISFFIIVYQSFKRHPKPSEAPQSVKITAAQCPVYCVFPIERYIQSNCCKCQELARYQEKGPLQQRSAGPAHLLLTRLLNKSLTFSAEVPYVPTYLTVQYDILIIHLQRIRKNVNSRVQ